MTKTNYINASIYSSEKQTFIDNQFMTVDDATGKIIAVGTGTPDTIAEQTTDMQGKYVMPGIMNAHTQLPVFQLTGGMTARKTAIRSHVSIIPCMRFTICKIW